MGHDHVVESAVAPLVSKPSGPGRQVRLALTMREFDLPPIRDALVIGRRAPIGPRGMFEALDRMLPDTFELVSVEEHPKIEAVIIRKTRFRFLERGKLVALFVHHAEALMHESTLIEVELNGEVSVRVELET